ncbi:TPA: SapB/AmfS family lantipeptide [Streptococcus pneumoniae]|nr:SapB/AmfS family lantipeptide [Streptococcus pneumoniae]HEW9630387.1 SapB/AmfS family lantipeptide [Streptococcus pneumoniae]
MAEEVFNLQLVSVQVDETDEVDGMRFSTFSTNRCGNWSAFSWENC